MGWFRTKPVEELYDVENDPYELHNLAGDSRYNRQLTALRTAFRQWTRQVGDRSDIPEREMIRTMWNGKEEPPATAAPKVIPASGGVRLTCLTKGASIGYRVVKAGAAQAPKMHDLQTWDFRLVSGGRVSGKQAAPPVWLVYKGETIPLANTDTLHINAMRIGFRAATLDYLNGQVMMRETAPEIKKR
jgi:N-sulfoglucosamine sulfohydrolase